MRPDIYCHSSPKFSNCSQILSHVFMIYIYWPTSNVPARRASNRVLNGVYSRGTKVRVGSRQEEGRTEAGKRREEGLPMHCGLKQSRIET